MDPNMTLTDILSTVDSVLDDGDKLTNEQADELCQKVRDLDQWLRSGGFKPARWL